MDFSHAWNISRAWDMLGIAIEAEDDPTKKARPEKVRRYLAGVLNKS